MRSFPILLFTLAVFVSSPTGGVVAHANPNQLPSAPVDKKTALSFSEVADSIIQANQSNVHLGYSVAEAGDVNNDGYDDIIVGAHYYSVAQYRDGAAFIFHGGPGGIASGSPATAVTTLYSNQDSSSFGTSVASAGDVNGDGFDDVIVGADGYRWGPGTSDNGAAFIFHGGPNGVASGSSASAQTSLRSGRSNSQFGSCVSSAGDVNGDGYADVVVADHVLSDSHLREGGAFVFHGGPNGVPNATSYTAATSIQADQTEAYLSAVAGAGDVNGDGFDDIVVGASSYTVNEVDEGAAFVIHGRPGGIPSGSAATVSSAVLRSDQFGGLLGGIVAGAGDVNGDEFDDVIIGALYYDAGQTDEGAAFVFHGGPNGIPSGTAATAATRIQSDQENAQLGSVEGAGDLNGDGYDDVIVGARHYDAGAEDSGAAFVFYGSPSGVPDGTPITASRYFPGDQTQADFGRDVSSAGDVNGDGFDDALQGAFTYSSGETWEGAAFLYYGAASGDSVGLYVEGTGTFFLTNVNRTGAADLAFSFGAGGMGIIPIVGDWDGDGDSTPGLYDPTNGFFFLRNGNSPGPADATFGFGPGQLGWLPLVGDWDGDGTDTIGLYSLSNGFFFLRNTNASGSADLTFGFGPGGLGWVPIVGDWDGDGDTTVGLYNPANGFFFLRNTNESGAADLTFGFGPGGLGWLPIAGDWDGDGDDTVGLFADASSAFFLINRNASGPADITFVFGAGGATPVRGNWDGL